MSTFRHIMLMTFNETATTDQIEAAVQGLRTMPEKVPGILRYDVGLDLGLGGANPDLALVADFESDSEWRSYLEHPAHLELIGNQIKAVKGSVTRIQYLVE